MFQNNKEEQKNGLLSQNNNGGIDSLTHQNPDSRGFFSLIHLKECFCLTDHDSDLLKGRMNTSTEDNKRASPSSMALWLVHIKHSLPQSV